MSTVRITGGGPAELKRLSAELRAADPELKRALRRNLREAAKPVTAAVQNSIFDMPAHHYTEGLRGEVAATVRATTRITKNGIAVEIVSDGRWMPEGKENLPALLDRPEGFGHPVFARGARVHWTWRHQMGKRGWFERPVTQAYPRFQRAAQAAVDEVRRKLEH